MKRWMTILCALSVYLMVSLPCNSVYAAARRPVVKAKTSWLSKLGQSIHDFLFGPPVEYIDERKAPPKKANRKAPLRNRDHGGQEVKRNGGSSRSYSAVRERSNSRRLRKDYDSSDYYSSSDYDSRERYSRRPRRGSSRSDFRQRHRVNKRRTKQASKTSPSKSHRSGKSSPSKESKPAKSAPSKKQQPGKSDSSNIQQSDKSAPSKRKSHRPSLGPNIVPNPCAAPVPPMLVLEEEEEEEVADQAQAVPVIAQANVLPRQVHLGFFHIQDQVINIPPLPQMHLEIRRPRMVVDIAPQQMQIMAPQVQVAIAPAQQPQQPQQPRHRLRKKKKKPRVDNTTQRPPRKRKGRSTDKDKEPPQQQPQPNPTVEQDEGDGDEETMPTTADFIARNQRITEEEEEDKKLDVAEDANGHVGIILEEEEEEEEDINDKKRSSALVDQDGPVSKVEAKDVKKDEPQIVQQDTETIIEEEEEEENNELGDDIQVTPTPSPQVQAQQDSNLDHAEVRDTAPVEPKNRRCDVM